MKLQIATKYPSLHCTFQEHGSNYVKNLQTTYVCVTHACQVATNTWLERIECGLVDPGQDLEITLT